MPSTAVPPDDFRSLAEFANRMSGVTDSLERTQTGATRNLKKNLGALAMDNCLMKPFDEAAFVYALAVANPPDPPTPPRPNVKRQRGFDNGY
jgi:hypothetical protein